jgi:molecular chaperone DnaJ
LVGEDIEVNTSISFVEAAKGVHRDVRTNPLVNCKTCAGSGMKADTKKRECGRCGGTGTRVHFMQGGFQMAATCEACGGNGVVIPPGSECNTCHGNGVMHDSRTVGVNIPAGIDSDMRLRVSGEGDAPSMASSDSNVRTQRGDLFVHIRVEPHPKFGRKGSDITYTATIPMTTALLGGVVKIPTLDDEVDLRVPTGTNTGDRIVMSGMGMKKLNSGRRGEAGDLRVEFKVNMPK